MKVELAEIVRTVMTVTTEQRGKDLVDFQALAMKNLNSAKEFFESRWERIPATSKMDILMILDCDIKNLERVHELSLDAMDSLVELIILREKDKEYLPM